MEGIVFEPLFEDVEAPSRATEGSAGYDVRAHVRGRRIRVWRAGEVEERDVAGDGVLVIEPGEVALVPLGFRARLPSGFEAQLRLRSSIAFKRGVVMPNAPGTIDADYPDEWLVMLKNVSLAPVRVVHRERLAQVVFARFEALEWEFGEVQATTRVGGLGSSGEG